MRVHVVTNVRRDHLMLSFQKLAILKSCLQLWILWMGSKCVQMQTYFISTNIMSTTWIVWMGSQMQLFVPPWPNGRLPCIARGFSPFPCQFKSKVEKPKEIEMTSTNFTTGRPADRRLIFLGLFIYVSGAWGYLRLPVQTKDSLLQFSLLQHLWGFLMKNMICCSFLNGFSQDAESVPVFEAHPKVNFLVFSASMR